MVETTQLLQNPVVKTDTKNAKGPPSQQAAQGEGFQAALISAQAANSAAIRNTGEKETADACSKTQQKQGQKEGAKAENPEQSAVAGLIVTFVFAGFKDCSLIQDAVAPDTGSVEALGSNNTGIQTGLTLPQTAADGGADKALAGIIALDPKEQSSQKPAEGVATALPKSTEAVFSAEQGGSACPNNGTVTMSGSGEGIKVSDGFMQALSTGETRLNLNPGTPEADTEKSLTTKADSHKAVPSQLKGATLTEADIKASYGQLAAKNDQPSATLQSTMQSNPSMQSASQPFPKTDGENITSAKNVTPGTAQSEPKPTYLNEYTDAQPKTDDTRQPQTEVSTKAVKSEQEPEAGSVRALKSTITEKETGNDIKAKAVFENVLQTGDVVQNGKEASLGKADAKPERRAAEAPVWDQVSAQITNRFKEDSTSFQMKLKPDGLGQLTVEMKLENGKVSLQMITDSAAAKDAIVSQLDELKTALRANQVDVSQINVEAGGQQQKSSNPFGPFGGNENGQGYKEAYTKQSKTDLRHEEPAYAPQRDFTDGIIDYKV